MISTEGHCVIAQMRRAGREGADHDETRDACAGRAGGTRVGGMGRQSKEEMKKEGNIPAEAMQGLES